MSGEVEGWFAANGRRVDELELSVINDELAKAAAILRPLASVIGEPQEGWWAL